jgi:hypothetical protein
MHGLINGTYARGYPWDAHVYLAPCVSWVEIHFGAKGNLYVHPVPGDWKVDLSC